MKRELLLSALLATSPMTFFSTSSVASLRSDLLSDYQKEFGMILSSKSTVTYKGEKVFALVVMNRGNFKEKNGGNNKIRFELQGTISLVNEKNETIETVGEYDDGEVMFDLASDDERETKYIGYACSSTYTDCGPAANMILRFLKAEKTWTLSFDKLISTDEAQPVNGSDSVVQIKSEIFRVENLVLEVLKNTK